MSIPDIFRAAVVWVFSILLYLHILAAIFWFGSGLMLQLVFIPSLAGMTFDAQHAWLQALTRRYSRVIGAVGGLTVLLGIVRGISTGVLGALNTPYGITYLVAIVLAVPLIVVGARFVGPTAQRMAAATSSDEVVALSRKIRRYGVYEEGGMLVMLALMVAMHAGY
jgi:uncharacterized membrane protein